MFSLFQRKPKFDHETLRSRKSFLFIRPEGMGDIILTLPAIAYVRSQNPAARLAIAVRPMFAQFVREMRVVEEVIPLDYPKRSTLTLRQIRPFLKQVMQMRRRFDVAFDFRGDPRNALIGAWSAGMVVGAGSKATNFLLACIYQEPARVAMAERNLRIVSLCQKTAPAVEEYSAALRYRIDDETRQRVSRLLPESFVLIHPGASRPSNRWAEKRWADLICTLLESGESIVLTGAGAEDSQLVSSVLRDLVTSARITNLVGRTSSSELTAIVQRAKVVISPDTAVAHIAFAHQVPSVTIFGSDSEVQWGHPTPINLPASVSLPCRPCMAYRCPRRDHPMACTDYVSVDQISAAATTVMRKN